MAKKLRKTKACLNCGIRINNSNYCPDCGQLNTNKQAPLRQIINDFLDDYFTFDSKFFHSFLPLIGKPGYLTNQYNEGKRSRFILPLRLYIFTTFFFFLIITLNNKINDWNSALPDEIEVAATEDSLEHFIDRVQPDISIKKRSQLARLLYRHFDITYLKSENSEQVFDSLKIIIRKYSRLTNEKAVEQATCELDLNFSFEQKDKESKEKHLVRLDSALQFYKPQINSLSAKRIIAALDSTFYIKAVKRRADVGEIKIFYQDADSVDNRFANFIETKIKKIANRGDEGSLLFLSEMLNQVPKVLFLLLPIFALLLKLFYIRHKVVYINHLIFALHLHTIFFIYILIPVLFTNGYVILAMLIALWFHILLSFKNVYRQSKIKTFIKMNSIMFIYTFVIFASVLLLFLLAIVNI